MSTTLPPVAKGPKKSYATAFPSTSGDDTWGVVFQGTRSLLSNFQIEISLLETFNKSENRGVDTRKVSVLRNLARDSENRSLLFRCNMIHSTVPSCEDGV